MKLFRHCDSLARIHYKSITLVINAVSGTSMLDFRVWLACIRQSVDVWQMKKVILTMFCLWKSRT